MPEFTHVDEKGNVRMVDVTEKESTLRIAVAGGTVAMNRDTFEKIVDNRVKKGNVLEAARIAGVMAAKKTADLIPMCHPLNITYVSIDFIPDEKNSCIGIRSEVRLKGRTGVEMEALTAASVCALTIYDMCKSHDRGMIITNIKLLEKSGGKSGEYKCL
ncbi:MAG: cyclic pyranopterin monophosphate synthase MoaC [Deltaproteobacteria bacterium]|nr:cyclic pyranopterin monophosphate synthase MoaC [Deltaproteobacteria bacterium]MBW2220001.1 cyclic pyranopterin monophosphate synthase MoaC [Deltaproteobacteria bacterium]